MDELIGVKLTTSAVREISGDLKTISGNVDDIMSDFNSIMQTFTGQAEGGLIVQTTVAAEQLFDGVMSLSKCFIKLGFVIGEFLDVLISQDAELAQNLKNKIES